MSGPGIRFYFSSTRHKLAVFPSGETFFAWSAGSKEKKLFATEYCFFSLRLNLVILIDQIRILSENTLFYSNCFDCSGYFVSGEATCSPGVLIDDSSVRRYAKCFVILEGFSPDKFMIALCA